MRQWQAGAGERQPVASPTRIARWRTRDSGRPSLKSTIIALAAVVAVVASITLPVTTVGAAPTAWSVTPTGSNPNSFLSGVSCPTSTMCMAVGGAAGSAIAAVWDGSSWSVVPTPTPSGGDFFNGYGLSSVSCIGPTSCQAVGNLDFSTGHTEPLIESWDGTSWTILPTPTFSPPQYIGGSLVSISCDSTTSCVAVGALRNNVGSGKLLSSLVMTWDGSTWSTTPAVDPGLGNDVMDGVACTSPTSCMAVGNWTDGVNPNGGNLPNSLVESWDGTSWSEVPNPSPGANSTLRGISCSNPSSCVAVGISANGALVESWDGSAWTVVANPGLNSTWESVSCSSATDCVATGSSGLIESFDGVAWTLTSAPSVGVSRDTPSVSCTSVNCTAVGRYQLTDGGDSEALIETATLLPASLSVVAQSTLPATPGPVTYDVAATGTGPAPTGMVTVSDGQGGSCSIPTLSSGLGSCAIDESASLSPYAVTASYSGDSFYFSATASITVSGGVSTNGTATATNNQVSATATGGTDGVDTVGVTHYGADPVGPLTDGNNYFDVNVSSGSTFSTVTVQDCNNVTSLTTLTWWDPTANGGQGGWVPVVGNPGPTYLPGSPACISVSLDSTSSPTISQLTGTVFGVVAPPSITKFTPTRGPVGTVVTIKGTNLAGATKVTFNGVKGTITSDSATKIKVKVPSGATTGKIKVVGPSGKATSATAFTVT
jgi:hypothetical protein